MTVRNLMLDGINRLFRLRGMELRTCPALEADSSMNAALARAARLACDVATVIDVGAAAGAWTASAMPYFPGAKFLMIEPLREREPELAALGAQHANVDFALAAAGDVAGEAVLSVAEDLDGSGIYGRATGTLRRVPVITIDQEVATRDLPPPFFIKLDTHGFETAILTGARETLARTSLLMVEAYNFVLSPGCLRFHELCAWLEPFGFRPCDLVELVRRARDGVLWQMDFVFARQDHPAFAHTSYR